MCQTNFRKNVDSIDIQIDSRIKRKILKLEKPYVSLKQ